MAVVRKYGTHSTLQVRVNELNHHQNNYLDHSTRSEISMDSRALAYASLTTFLQLSKNQSTKTERFQQETFNTSVIYCILS